MSGQPEGAPSLEDRLERIDKIVAALDSDSVGLGQALALFEEGIQHVKKAEEVLEQAELRVTELAGPEGETEVAFDLEDGEGPDDS